MIQDKARRSQTHFLTIFAVLTSQGLAACSSGSDAGSPDAGPLCQARFQASDAGSAATISIDPSQVVNTFVPKAMFGVNTGVWVSKRDMQAVASKVQAAGNYLIRFPGGSRSDDYHWNGTGSFDTRHRWAPSDSQYSPGFSGSEMHRGTTSAGYSAPSLITDGKADTFWVSNQDTASPSAQWVYLDLGAVKAVDSLQITWATPYATSFEVQTWSGTSSWPPPYQATGSAAWQSTSAGTITGSGGVQTVSFTEVSTQFVRILMTASSDGAEGAYAIAEVTAFKGADAITKNVATISQTAVVVSSTDPASTTGATDAVDFEAFMAYLHSFSPAADAMVTVNVGTGTAQEAAAWVHYANVVKGYGIHTWEIGNEMEASWETGGPLDARDYAKRYVEFYDAMKKEDPSIVVLGPVSGGIGEPSNLGDGKSYIQAFIDTLAANGQADRIDGISFHWYPNWETVSDDAGLASVSQLGTLAGNLKTWLSAAKAKPSVSVFLTEYNMGIGAANPPVYNNQLVNGLFTASTLGEYIRYFGKGGGTVLWMMLAGGSTNDWSTATAGDLGYLQTNNNPYIYQEHASYWAMQMMAANWSIAGDTRTHQLVSSTSSIPSLATYADLRPDGALALAVINRDSKAHDATIGLGSFATGSAADVWTFDATNYVWETSSKPYHAEPDTAPTHALTCGAGSSTPFVFPPFSITVIRFAAPGAPTAVLPDAGTTAPKDTGVPVPANKSYTLIDDMEKTSSGPIQLGGSASGVWFGMVSTGSTENTVSPSPFAFSALSSSHETMGNVTSSHAAHVVCSMSDQYGYCQVGFNFVNPTAPFDIGKYRGMSFWAMSSLSNALKFQIANDDSVPEGGRCGKTSGASDSCWNSFATNLALTDKWQKFEIAFSDLRQDSGWGMQVPSFETSSARTVSFLVQGPTGAGGAAVAADFWIDDVYFFQ
jgi:hypothetical protein